MTVNITPLHGPRPRTQAGRERSPERRHHHSGHGQRKPQEGDVIAVGAGKIEKGHRVPLDVKVGDRILFGKYTGNEIQIDDQEYLILREEEILMNLSGMAKAASGKK